MRPNQKHRVSNGQRDNFGGTYHLSDHDEFGAKVLADGEGLENPDVEDHQVQGENDAGGVKSDRVESQSDAHSEHHQGDQIHHIPVAPQPGLEIMPACVVFLLH